LAFESSEQTMSEAGRYTGKVKFFTYGNGGGWGYITPDAPIPGVTDDGSDVFLHISAVRKCADIFDDDILSKGTRLSFELALNSRRGNEPCAVRLKILEWGAR
jgi:cold shock CspA family protein